MQYMEISKISKITTLEKYVFSLKTEKLKKEKYVISWHLRKVLKGIILKDEWSTDGEKGVSSAENHKNLIRIGSFTLRY